MLQSKPRDLFFVVKKIVQLGAPIRNHLNEW